LGALVEPRRPPSPSRRYTTAASADVDENGRVRPVQQRPIGGTVRVEADAALPPFPAQLLEQRLHPRQLLLAVTVLPCEAARAGRGGKGLDPAGNHVIEAEPPRDVPGIELHRRRRQDEREAILPVRRHGADRNA